MAARVDFDEAAIAPAPFKAGLVRFRRLRVLFALLSREMATSFGTSYGGYLWALAEPLGGIILLSVVFSLALRTPPLGDSFMFFYATGTMPYQMYKTNAKEVATAVKSNTGLLTYSVVTTLDAVFAKFLFRTVTMLMVTVLLIGGIAVIDGMTIKADMAKVAMALGMAASLGLGIGTLNCVLIGFFPPWRSIWKIIGRPVFVLSGVLYVYEAVPPVVQGILWYNPVIHVTALMRSGFFPAYDPTFISYRYVMGIAMGTFVVGAYLLRRHSTALINA